LLAAVTHRHVDHTEFWNEAIKRFPDDAEFMRRKVQAALQSGRIADADSALGWLMNARACKAADARFVIGLTHADMRTGDAANIRRRVRSFLASLRGMRDYRIAAVRLSRVIFAHFPARPDGSIRSSALRSRFQTMLAKAPLKREPRKLLDRSASCEAALERMYPHCFFQTDVAPEQRRAFISLVRARVALQQPFSFVRIGDGEAACLPYEPRLAAHAPTDARDRERIWWGEALKPGMSDQTAPRIARAMLDADCIGLPTTARFLRELNLQREDTLETSLTGRGLRCILYCSERLAELRSPGLPPPILTSCHLHQDLALWDCYEELLDGVKEIVLVSCHPGLADWIGKRFGSKIAGNVVLPPDKVSAPLLRSRVRETRKLPEILDAVIEEMGDLPRGRLVLVGAGYPGKLLTGIARERGGIALDLGSIFDYWLGLNTRSYLDLDPV
jgi:hypothetical protein